MITDTEGIILRQVKTVNGRRMVLLFSKKFGKISAGTGISEKGRGKSGLAMRPFTYGRYELFKGRDLYNINSAETLKSYYKIGEDVDKYMNASYVLELTEKLITEEQPMPGLFNLLLDFMSVMENRRKKYGTIVLAYEIKALKYIGLTPRLDECAACNARIERQDKKAPVHFSIKDGGIICPKCMKTTQDADNDKLIYTVSFGIVDILKYILKNSLRGIENLALEENTFNNLQSMIKGYLEYHLDMGELKSESFIGDYN